MLEPIKIDVCIATFKRPFILSKLLDSLKRQNLAGFVMRIVIIDNDKERSAYPVVESYRRQNTGEIIYDVEPKQNIALARNLALRHVQAEYFAFVDDDETVSSVWLKSMFESLVRYQADVVFGPVISTLPNDAPTWAKRCFNRIRRQTGTLVQFGGAGNVMMKRAVIENKKIVFDPDFGLTGGEDTEFFYRLFLAGRRLVWCDEALIAEPVPQARLTLAWVRRRGFRSGQNYNRIFVRHYSTYKKIGWFVMKVGQLIGGVVAAPIVCCVSYPSYVALTIRVASATGQLSYCFLRKNFEEYNARNYQ